MSDELITDGEGTGPRDPEQLEATATTANAEIAPETHMGPVHLTVADLGRSIRYYEQQIGLEVVAQDDGVATLGSGRRGLLVLTELPGAPPARGHTGLYHFALLVPKRGDLARWLAHAARDRVTPVGLSDHFVSEALYLRHADHHNLHDQDLSANVRREPRDGELEGGPHRSVGRHAVYRQPSFTRERGAVRRRAEIAQRLGVGAGPRGRLMALRDVGEHVDRQVRTPERQC